MLRCSLQSILLALSLLAALVLSGCGSSETTALDPIDDNPFKAYRVGGDQSFEAVTWNLHNFPNDGLDREIELVAQAIEGMGADVVALQEIANVQRFPDLLERLPAWSGYVATSDRFQNLAYVWLDSTVTVSRVREILTSEWQPLPRSPLVLELTWQDKPLVLVNNHLKCCGDGTLDGDDPDDEENRRLVACQLLEAWIATEHPDDAVILLGDLNDHLDDAAQHNVFAPFLDRPASYEFADMAVAVGPAVGWSWGPGQSHLDHILVTDELFGALVADGASCATLRIDRALDGEFRDKVSDHAPVAVVLPGDALP
jgi:endonuclease/exonuclease/phosphatase family metal-dependent hydrolase